MRVVAAEASRLAMSFRLSQVAALHGLCSDHGGGKTPALRGVAMVRLAERIAGFLLNGYFFRCVILYAS